MSVCLGVGGVWHFVGCGCGEGCVWKYGWVGGWEARMCVRVLEGG